MEKTQNNKAWFLVLPVLVLVAFSAVIPLMTVVNYAFNDTFGNNAFFWAGLDWFEDQITSERLHNALGRQILFSLIILAIEVPLGIVYIYADGSLDAWITVVVMDVWHWTSLVALLCYAGLQSIPQAYYQAAKIDQATRWSVFRYIELPKMKGVLLIAVLLRFMDSCMIYTEPFVVTGGGPGNSTTFLSIDLVKMAVGQFDLGPAAAFSIMYFLVILLVSWVFYTVMTSLDREEDV